MNGKAYNSAGTELQNIDVLRCRPFPVPRLVQGQTMGGTWYTQEVGTAAKKASVELRVIGTTARDGILDAWATSANITLDFDGYRRTGFIMAEPSEELVKVAEDPDLRQFSMSFQFAVQLEEASS